MATLQEWDTSYAPKGVELEDVTDDWYDEDGNLIPWPKLIVTQEQGKMVNGSLVLNALKLLKYITLVGLHSHVCVAENQ